MTLALLVLGYSGFYLCRSNFSVALPLILDELAASGMDRGRAKELMGWVASAGLLAYALGKLPGGGLCDFCGGRRVYLGGMAGSVAFTLAFAAAGTVPAFTMAWVANRAVQSVGWPGMVKVVSRWFPYSSYGAAMGVVSLSFLWGDSAGRLGMGFLLGAGVGWRALFLATALILLGLLVLNATLLRESPVEVGLDEPPTAPENLFGADGAGPSPPGLRALLLPLLTSPVFWLVCLLSFGLTMVRETFNTWSSTYFVEAVGMQAGRAARMSALFPLAGGFSVLLAGYLGDHTGRGGRAAVMLVGLTLAGFALAALGLCDPKGPSATPVALVAAVAFLIIGPYSYLAGAMALDLGGKRGGATACGLIDFVGYLGGVLSGRAVASLAVNYGWRGAFLALSAVAWASAAAAGVLLAVQRRGARA